MKRRLLALALSLTLIPTPAFAHHAWLNSNGDPMHWQRGGDGMSGALTINGYRYIGIHNGIAQTGWFPGYLADAAERWNDPTWHAAILTPYNLDPNQYPWPCDWTPPPSGWGVSLCTGNPESPTAYADTTVMSQSAEGHMGWVRIRIRPGLSQGVMMTVLTHELGHALGLYHRPTNVGSVMDSNGGFGWPDWHDMDVVAGLYAHSH